LLLGTVSINSCVKLKFLIFLRIEKELDIPAVPEMIFGNTFLEITHDSNRSIVFNAVDALRLVDNKHDLVKVAYANEWQKQREGCTEIINGIVKPFDWTYSTSYKGTFKGENPFKEVETLERIDLEKLKQREKIIFYQDLLLFEDELGDNGTAELNVKIRVMPTSFFVLLRFFLRVDDVLIRINDTRIFHEAGTDYILREYSSKEKNIKDIPNPLADVNILSTQLATIIDLAHKIML